MWLKQSNLNFLLLSFSTGALYLPISKQLFQSQIFFIVYNNKIIFMDINQLILLVKKKIKEKISLESINIEDKSFLHKNHASNQTGKFHLKLIIQSKELKKVSKIESNKKIYKILDYELKQYIHSIQILIS